MKSAHIGIGPHDRPSKYLREFFFPFDSTTPEFLEQGEEVIYVCMKRDGECARCMRLALLSLELAANNSKAR